MTPSSDSPKWLAPFVRTLESETQALTLCLTRLNAKSKNYKAQQQAWDKAFEVFMNCLNNGGRIAVTGLGKSGKVCQKISATLSSTGSPSYFIHPTEALHGDLGMIHPLDCVLALSYSGTTQEIGQLHAALKTRTKPHEQGIPFILMSGNSGSSLAQAADVFLDAHVESEACPHNLAPTSSTTLSLALGDAIAVALMELRGFKKETFASFHPGGSLGRKLHSSVKHLMRTGDDLPFVESKASMQEVILMSTQKGLGVAIVRESGKFIGIITDGDLRRALGNPEHFFEKKAQDICTRRPKTISAETSAIEALELMERHNPPLNLLPVVDKTNQCVGIVRLHDLLG